MIRKWVSIEGCIGCGKTTIMKKLEELGYKNVYYEPVNEWEEYLKLFYENKNRYAFHIQAKTLLSFYNIYKQLRGVAITERSYVTSFEIFTAMHVHSGRIDNISYKLMKDMVHTLFERRPSLYIYIKSDPKTCYNRIIQRGDSPIDINYLEELNKKHDEYFTHSTRNDVFICDSSHTPLENAQKIINFIQK